MSEKELKALGFSPKKIKEVMADGAKNPMSQEEVLEDITKPQELELAK
jgi:DNA-binding transcriptional MerR regulator